MSDDAAGQLEWLPGVLARYEARLLRYAARIAGDAELARDVVQEAFLRLAQQDPAQLDGHLAQWLYTVCRRRALDVRRKETCMQSLSEAVAAGCEAAERQPAEALIAAESSERIVQLLAALPESQQEAVRLKFQEGLSYREIAGVLGLSVSHVGVLLHTALKTIRRKLESEE